MWGALRPFLCAVHPALSKPDRKTKKGRIMPVITLPDGSQRQFDRATTLMELAAAIGPGLAKATLAGEVNGVVRDASFSIDAEQ